MDHTEGLVAACPADELLLAYLLDPAQVPPAVGQHLDGCDHCVAEIARAQRRLGLAAEIARPVPTDVFERAAASSATVERPAAAVVLQHQRRTVARRAPLARFRPAVWVPVALAAAALLALTLRMPPPGVAPQSELSRAVELRQDARVTRATTVRQQPNAEATVLRSLNRGDAVVLFDRSEDWYQVALPDGTQGWIEVGAFE